MNLKTCVSKSGCFIFGVHKPAFQAENLREHDAVCLLGNFEDGTLCNNNINFPEGMVTEENADHIYEIPNAFPFRGTTYIIKSAADRNSENLSGFVLPQKPCLSMSEMLKNWAGSELTEDKLNDFFCCLPGPLLLTLASNSTDPEDLTRIADYCCKFVRDPETGRPKGFVFRKDNQGHPRAVIKDHTLCEVLANNIFLPDDYKEVMVLRPGVQGASEIVGEWSRDNSSHVYEYLRRNSYIPWGHYAANMANDAIRYRAEDLSYSDIKGMRHLYYQRTYVRLAQQMGIAKKYNSRKTLDKDELENLRIEIIKNLADKTTGFNSTLWGWNFGFDYAASGYRLHASHQQIHQQYALIPSQFSCDNSKDGESFFPFSFGGLAADFVKLYKDKTGANFFDNYIKAIKNNTRVDQDKNKESDLVIYKDENVMLFVPKAQTSQWEIQLMTLAYAGNILETDKDVRKSLDTAMLIGVQILEKMGARMITHIECSKPFDCNSKDQRLLYCFLPKMPYSPGSFTEAQLRWINGHYPEDFAKACRTVMTGL